MPNISGTTSIQVNLTDAIASGAGHLTAYSVPCRPVDSTQNYALPGGTGPNQAQRHYSTTNTLSASTPVSIDLTAVTTSDGTTGFAHVRGLFIYNDDPTNVITFGGGSNPFVPFLGGTSPTVVIQPGTCQPFQKPLGTNGWAVSSGSKVVQLDPGTNAIAGYRVVAFGD